MSLGYSQRAVAGGRGRGPPARARDVCDVCAVSDGDARAARARHPRPRRRAQSL